MEKITKHPQNDELEDRTNLVSAFMGETIEYLLWKLVKGINATEVADKDRVFVNLHNCLAGLQDGIWFDREDPYTKGNPKVKREGDSSRMIGS